ncbi:MAG TPA: SRPBCC domain-containing protein, partial [Planctomycetia bacterium]|nr:SRPBCC domain-containing protein [Planctomycetia bacterium]
MPLKKDPSGRRSVEVSVEVPGTPEQVWAAIATGPGVSSWFVPTEADGRVGGRIVANFGPGMESVSTCTKWDPPRMFAADSADLGPGSPNVATEWHVEAKDGGTCIVRVVHSLFTDKDDWDDQLAGWEHGWPGFFRILRLYLLRFPGMTGAGLQAGGLVPGPRPEAWSKLVGPINLADASEGDSRRSPPDAPTIGGRVEQAGEAGHPEGMLLSLDAPCPGIAHLFAMDMA